MHCPLLRDARRALAAQQFDALVLDVGLPDGNGLDLCREIRIAGSTPVLMLSARGEELDRIVGLELGADDYMAKPFSPRELVARLRALLRRSSSAQATTPAAAAAAATVAKASVFSLDAAGQRIHMNRQVLELTRREHGLLAVLLAAKGRILSRDNLLNAVWGMDADSADRTVDTHIKTLRAKLRAIDADCEYIITHRGMGYSLLT